MWHRITGRLWVTTALVVAVFSSSCARTVTNRLAAYHPGGPPTTQPAPEAGRYRVQYLPRGAWEYRDVDSDTVRLLQRGDVVGFRTDENGSVVAVVNRESLPVALPSDDVKLVWYAHYEKTTRFGRTSGEAAELTGHVVSGAIVLGIVIAIVIGALIAESAADD